MSNLESALKIVNIGEPVLRKPAKILTKEEILKEETQALIQEMKKTMHEAPGVGLAAPQVGKSLQIAVIEDREEYHKSWTPAQLEARKRVPVPFHVIINPKIVFRSQEMTEFYEGCLSIPNLIGVVSRSKEVIVECLNERGEPMKIHASGWFARILQHEFDHLNGILNIDKTVTTTLTNFENFEKYWKAKS